MLLRRFWSSKRHKSFISREKGQTMHATLQMVRDVARRGRKRWLSLAFVSQQPGHLPPEIFELCNTRYRACPAEHAQPRRVNGHGRRRRAGEMWARCPLLGSGEAIVTSPQLKRPVVVTIRPAMSQRRLVSWRRLRPCVAVDTSLRRQRRARAFLRLRLEACVHGFVRTPF